MEKEIFEIENLLYNLITENDYDRRLIPYIKEFFIYNAKQFAWNEGTITKKVGLLKDRIHGIEFADLRNKFAATDFDFKNILVNSSVKGRILSKEDLLELTSEIFERLEIATKDTEEYKLKYWENKSLYPLESLKYSTRIQEKESIIRFISNAFNIDLKDVYEIGDIFEERLVNVDKSNRSKKNFLEDSVTTLLPSISESVARIMNNPRGIDKSEEYLSIYAISMLSIGYRLEDETEDKELLKRQYEALNKELMEIAEEYVITADRLSQHRVSSTFSINLEAINKQIRNGLGEIKAKEDRIEKIDDFGAGLGENFFKEASSISREEILEDAYMKKQIDVVLLRYEERFRPIIQEYIARSAKVYGWTKDEFDKKVRNYLQNISSIEFTKKIEGHGISTMGCWSYRNKKFYVKADTVLVKDDEILDVFFHEQEHATDVVIRNNQDELEGGLQYNSINEYATEIGAIHLVGNKTYEDELCFTHRMNGYGDIKYAGSMMAAALGISEFEFARLRDKGNEEFKRYFQEKFNYIDIENELERFDDILDGIINAPSIINMREMSEGYAYMYNMANRILTARLEHERKEVLPENLEEFDFKSRYEMSKIANNIKLAKRRLFLQNKYIKPIIEDDTIIKSYSKITSDDRKQYLALVERLYPEKNIKFDNRDILRHTNIEFKHPIRRKISKIFSKKNTLMLNAPREDYTVTLSNSERKKFQEGLSEGIVETPRVDIGKFNKRQRTTQITREE